MRTSLVVLVVISLLAVIPFFAIAACGGEGDQAIAEAMAEAQVEGQCPGRLTVGVPATIHIRVTNGSDQDWRVLYVSFFDGLDAFTIRGVAMGGASGERADTPGIDTFAFNRGLDAGERGRVRIGVVPNDVANIDLRFGAWGGWGGEPYAPWFERDDDALDSCEDITIRP